MTGSISNRLKQPYLSYGLSGSTLAILFLSLSAISSEFNHELSVIHQPVIFMVAMMVTAGGIYLFVVLWSQDIVFSKGMLTWVIGVGLLLRFSTFTSTPMLENDYFRYLWDGGVLTNGFNPYKYSPQGILNKEGDDIPDDLYQLACDSDHIIKRINHPWLRTIYPPISQFAFALAHTLTPWSMRAWRLVLFALDVVTLFLLLRIFHRLNVPLSRVTIYWWNPLLIKEIYNSGHMDVIILPFILGALLCSFQGRYVLASVLLGFAIGVKYWPGILFPVVVRPVLRDPKRLVSAALVFGCFAFVMFLPLYIAGLDSRSGFIAYGKHWEMNDALFMLILWVVKLIIGVFALDAGYAQPVTRTLISVTLLMVTVWVIRRNDDEPAEIAHRFLLVIAALFLLSPAQFPWYYLWILPFLAINPRISLLLLTVLLPFYYMRFYFNARGSVDLYDQGIVWLEFVPVWCLLIWEWNKGRKTKRYQRGINYPS